MKQSILGSVGVCTEEDSGRLYRLEVIQCGLYYLRSIDSPLSFRICAPDNFWILLDSL
jgi:hypothetical protein